MQNIENLASRLRHRVTLQQPLLGAQDGGHYTLGWQDVATLWAEIRPSQSRVLNAEHLFAEQLANRVSHEIRIRYRNGVSAEMRVKFNDRYFNIRSVINPQERNTMLLLLADEHVAQ